MSEVVKKKMLKLLDFGVIYPSFDSKWVIPIQVVPKKVGMTLVKNKKGESVSIITVIGWLICIDYMKLNKAIRKDYFHSHLSTKYLSIYISTPIFSTLMIILGSYKSIFTQVTKRK